MKAQWFNSVNQIGEAKWQAAIGELAYPFAQFAFHKALEESRCLGDGTGWYPEYLFVMDDDDTPLAIVPSYVKTHSQGEFVFDWSWADAYQQHGLEYYPKRIWAVPYSPVTGPRIFSHLDVQKGAQSEEGIFSYLYPSLAELMTNANQERGFSSWHLLFSEMDKAELLAENENYLHRISCQFHWFNRDYKDMADYFSHFSSRKRKAARKEREKVHTQGISLTRKLGSELTAEEIDFFYQCYQSTYAKRGQQGYLTQAFFISLAKTMGEQVLLVLAYRENKPIAASWCFFDEKSLYGRYWGCLEEIDCLHFEACYYQGIEFCLEKGLQHFDPGTQGEHKIARGFEPVYSHSIHYIAHEGFRHAISRFCEEEAQAVREYHQDTHALLPFKQQQTK